MARAAEIELLTELADCSLALWGVPKGARATLANLSENATFLVSGPSDYRAVLRVHREGYHTRRAIECEIVWANALRDDGVILTPRFIPGRNGSFVQCKGLEGRLSPRFLVLSEFIEGCAPDESGALEPLFEELGKTAARCHLHALGWKKPKQFERFEWNIESVFGSDATWGDWRAAPGVTAEIKTVLEQVERGIKDRLSTYGKAPERYNLIHADMRLANLLVHGNETRLIDFDDCGFGWLMYDFAAAISFIEDDPRISDLKSAWLHGYQTVRHLSFEDIDEVGTFVVLRRIALLAWIGSHIDAPEPQSLAPGFAEVTAQLGKKWLDQTGPLA